MLAAWGSSLVKRSFRTPALKHEPARQTDPPLRNIGQRQTKIEPLNRQYQKFHRLTPVCDSIRVPFGGFKRKPPQHPLCEK
jgi:hypothetical protein